MADAKQVVISSAICVALVLAFSGFAVRSWLKYKIEAAGSPSAFASQLALSGLERRLGGEMEKSLTPTQKDNLRISIRKAQELSGKFDQAQTIRLFEIIADFDKRIQSEHAQPSVESIDALVSGLESICQSITIHEQRNP